jgi:hypothetical protein
MQIPVGRGISGKGAPALGMILKIWNTDAFQALADGERYPCTPPNHSVERRPTSRMA